MTTTRGEQKERTRRAILDAALELSQQGGLSALSLRQVARRVGVVPTAFYRHFPSIDELGLELVDESFGSLRRMLREVREGASVEDVIDRSVEVLAGHVAADRPHFALIARELPAGPDTVRAAIRHQFELFERELVVDLAALVAPGRWSTEDLQVLANLIVRSMVITAEDLLDAGDRRGAAETVKARTRTQLRMLVVGAQNWASRG